MPTSAEAGAGSGKEVRLLRVQASLVGVCLRKLCGEHRIHLLIPPEAFLLFC